MIDRLRAVTLDDFARNRRRNEFHSSIGKHQFNYQNECECFVKSRCRRRTSFGPICRCKTYKTQFTLFLDDSYPICVAETNCKCLINDNKPQSHMIGCIAEWQLETAAHRLSSIEIDAVLDYTRIQSSHSLWVENAKMQKFVKIEKQCKNTKTAQVARRSPMKNRQCNRV